MKNAFTMPSRRLVSQDDRAIIQQPDTPRSRFMGSWTRKTAFDAGYLVPFMVDEVLPGDHLKYNVAAYVRMATPLFPILDNQRIDTFFFYVPARLLWDNWAKFMGEQTTPGEVVSGLLIPQLAWTAPQPVGSIYDHMGLPVAGQHTSGLTISVNTLPFRAYNIIFNEWFRDQNLTTPVPVTKGNGPDDITWYTLQRRAKSHDYFTTALPWPQRFTAPTIPVGGLAPVQGIGQLASHVPTNTALTVLQTGSPGSFNNPAYSSGVSALYIKASGTAAGSAPQVYADLSQATGVAIDTFRRAWMIQSLNERDARGGSRYVELIRSHFGVTSPDFRLSRPEYIGGGQTPLVITPVAQTAPSTGAAVGALGAAGTAVGEHRASYAATEHGYIIALINVRTELSYQQGIHRMWSRSTRYDFYWPALASLGEQAILRREIYATGNVTEDNELFGYQERWQEYRTRYSDVTGLMRSTAAGTLDMWHLGQKFTTPPFLNTTFLDDNPPMARVLAAGNLTTNQQYIADILIQRDAVRPLPMFGTPAQLARF